MTNTDAYDFQADQLPSAILADIDAFWVWFEEKAHDLDTYFSSQGEQGETDPFEVMTPLNDKFPDLMWEFGPSNKGHHLIVTAEWQDENRALARAFLRRAPNLSRWEISEVRPPSEPEYLVKNFEGRFQSKLLISDLQALVGENGRVDLHVEGGGDEDELIEQAIQLTTLLLGEEGDRDWLGLVIATPTKKTGGLISRLRGRTRAGLNAKAALQSMNAAIDASKAQRPVQPYHALDLESQGGTLFQLGNLPEDHLRADLITYLAPSERFGQAVLGGERFSSATHSAHGETFVTLQIPNQNGAPWDAKLRAEIEDMLHWKLAVDGIGGHVAGGSGTQLAYIDVALTDVAAGIALIGQSFRGLPDASEITFRFMDPGLTENTYPLMGGAGSVQ